MNVHIENKLEQIKAEILVCKHKAKEIWCSQCLHRLRLMEELKELINAATSGEIRT